MYVMPKLLFIQHGIELRTSDTAWVLLVDQAKDAANGNGGILVVAGNHSDADTCSVCSRRDCINALRARR